MGNTLTVEDTVGGGTTMVIEFKASAPQTPSELYHGAGRA
jgi:hypothetical protein